MLSFLLNHWIAISWVVLGVSLHPYIHKINGSKQTPLYHQIINGVICGWLVPFSLLFFFILKNIDNPHKYVNIIIEKYLNNIDDIGIYEIDDIINSAFNESQKYKFKCDSDVYLYVKLTLKEYNNILKNKKIPLSKNGDIVIAYDTYNFSEITIPKEEKNKNVYLVKIPANEISVGSISMKKLIKFLKINNSSKDTEVIINTYNIYITKENFKLK